MFFFNRRNWRDLCISEGMSKDVIFRSFILPCLPLQAEGKGQTSFLEDFHNFFRLLRSRKVGHLQVQHSVLRVRNNKGSGVLSS